MGKITPDGSKYYYYKDHLGSVRAVVNQNNQLVSAQDGVYPAASGNAWGYPMQDRTWQSDSSVYKFTSKERDNESTYDYFGARYYMSRIANWTTPDPLFEKHIGWTPYNYVLRNPIFLCDPSGRQIEFPNNVADQNLQIQFLQYLLPKQYSQFFGISTDQGGNQILDATLLQEAAEVVGKNSCPVEYGQLLTIAESSEGTTLRFIDENTYTSVWRMAKIMYRHPCT